MHIKIGTRASKLAIAQTNIIIEKITKKYPNIFCEIVEISTKGDKIQNTALSKIGDKGIFVTEIENQILDHSIDIAIHSMKDLPSTLPNSLTLTNISKREDPRDVLILSKECHSLKKNPIIGTSSIRRIVQIKKLIPDCIIKDIRGNIDTRIRKLDEGQYDAIILAAAGLKRLHLDDRIHSYLEPDTFIPACCQGAIAIECRKEDIELIELLNSISDQEDTLCTLAERNFLAKLDGTCHMPMGGYCKKNNDIYEFYGIYGQDETSTKSIFLTGDNPIELSNQACKILKENK